ncbi:MAG TPA: peroxide stress protein YaaA [Burkholderiaceae bacterium]|nr:peroxide stress protein YaaA [Burkholderiaceae bacterium]
MLYLLSPAKSLDYATPTPRAIAKLATDPLFTERAAELIGLMRRRSAAEVAEMMDLSDALATLNVARYHAWSPCFTPANSKPAALAFDGDVYGGLRAPELGLADLRWAQKHVAILSGLHGVLRPLDRLQPYRLEMGTRLPNPHGADLYAYWGDTIAQHLNDRAAEHAAPVIVNLASTEYFRAADRRALTPRVIECVFEDWKNGRYKIISFFAKRARGLMARHAITQRIATPAGLKKFDAEGYRFDAAVSERDRLVFRRRLD